VKATVFRFSLCSLTSDLCNRSGHSFAKVGLTGGNCERKSVVGEIVVRLGAHLIRADSIAHDLMQPGQAVYEEVGERFGPEILNPIAASTGRGWPRWRLGRRAAQFLRVKNSIPSSTGGRESARTSGWWRSANADPSGIAMVEAALILEAGGADRFDGLLL